MLRFYSSYCFFFIIFGLLENIHRFWFLVFFILWRNRAPCVRPACSTGASQVEAAHLAAGGVTCAPGEVTGFSPRLSM